MPIVKIGDLVEFSTNYGVMVTEKALALTPEKLVETLRLAFAHINDPPLVDACCGSTGPLAHYITLEFERYLELLREIEIAEAGTAEKKRLSRRRRSEFNGKHASIVLAMLDAGVPYVCAIPSCGTTDQLTVDHIRPLSRGGTDDLANLRFLCRSHNSAKGDRHEAAQPATRALGG